MCGEIRCEIVLVVLSRTGFGRGGEQGLICVSNDPVPTCPTVSGTISLPVC